jgi:transposase
MEVFKMIDERSSVQPKMEIVLIENLVPQDHILRKIDKNIDFSFIRELTKDLYCHDNGRPAVDPIILFKILFIGYLFGIRSERQLIRDIEVNIAYRWFLGYSLTEKVPSHSTISMNRITRFKGTGIYQKIFDEIVLQAISHKLVDGKVLYTDSTHLKANANKRKLISQEVEVSVKSYTEALDKAIDEDRITHGKKELKKN